MPQIVFISKNRFLMGLIVVCLIAVGAGGYWLCRNFWGREEIGKKTENRSLSTDGALNKVDEVTNYSSRPFLISAGVVPHHLVAKDLIEEFFSYCASQGTPETIVILGPDHFQAGSISGGRLITLSSQREEFYGLKIDYFLIEALEAKNNLFFSDSAIALDHGITNLLPFIKKYFPESKIAPFIIPANTSLAQSEQFAVSLDSLAFPSTLVIASVDFSHELPASAAEFHDTKSKRVLIKLEKEEFENIEVDSPQALYIARTFTHLRKKEFPEIIGQANSSDFLKADEARQTTSYFSLVFEERKLTEDSPLSADGVKTLLFVGDIMLDRNVEGLIDKNGPFYPFQRISQFLRGVDIVFGNLEGPIVAKPLGPIPHTMVFSFPPDVAETLALVKFDILSLANNHGLDMGQRGLEETREFLAEKGLVPLGSPGKCDGSFSWEKDGIKFFSLNKVYNPYCKSEDIFQAIKSARAASPDLFIIISVHWGEEYKLVNNSYQRKLAEEIIDAGADLIIGHHPHVVQNIDIYKGKLIFYSLGNFIFDQYFSKETQEGLAVGLELGTVPIRGQSPRLVYRLFPIQSHLSQPFLMGESQAKEFLEDLAARSSKELSHEIKNGIIVCE